jgi:hypothetical protein
MLACVTTDGRPPCRRSIPGCSLPHARRHPLFAVRHAMMQSSPLVCTWPLRVATQQLEEVRHGNDSNRIRAIGDHDASNRSTSHQVGHPSHRSRSIGRDDVRGHEVVDRPVLPDGRAIGTTGISVRHNADQLRTARNQQVVDSVLPHQEPCLLRGGPWRHGHEVSCHYIAGSHCHVLSQAIAASGFPSPLASSRQGFRRCRAVEATVAAARGLKPRYSKRAADGESAWQVSTDVPGSTYAGLDVALRSVAAVA